MQGGINSLVSATPLSLDLLARERGSGTRAARLPLQRGLVRDGIGPCGKPAAQRRRNEACAVPATRGKGYSCAMGAPKWEWHTGCSAASALGLKL